MISSWRFPHPAYFRSPPGAVSVRAAPGSSGFTWDRTLTTRGPTADISLLAFFAVHSARARFSLSFFFRLLFFRRIFMVRRLS
jgi:hypothetical protein